MSVLDMSYALILLVVTIYIWRREPPRLLLTPLMLLSFFVLYGIGNFVYFAGADTVLRVHESVTVSLLIMWIALLAGIELARATAPAYTLRAQEVVENWGRTPLFDSSANNQILSIIAIVAALFIMGMFFGMGKPGQLMGFVSIDSTIDKQKFRAEFSGQGGYVYHTLIASIAPFLAMLLLLKAKATRQTYLWLVGAALCVAVFAGKLGTFHKVPWLVFALQLIVVFQAVRKLDLGLARILGFLVLVLVGTALAAIIALPELDAVGIFEWLAYRFFEVNNEVVYQTFYVYPDHFPHTWGMNIGLIHRLFSEGELMSAHSRVANFFGADGATFDAFFIGDAWVDFSFAGVLVMSVLVGYVIKIIDIMVMSLGKTPLAMALMGSSMYGLFQLQVTSAFTAFLSGGLLFIPLVVILASAAANDLARRSGSSDYAKGFAQ